MISLGNFLSLFIRRDKQVICIAHGTIAEKDAIGTDIFYQSRLFEKLGLKTVIFGERILVNNSLRDSIVNEKEFLEIIKNKKSLLILHHSILWEKAEKILIQAKGYKIIKYHNITSANFFSKYNKVFADICEKSRIQLKRLTARKDINLWISDSNFNSKELIKFGVEEKNIFIIPPFNKIDILKSSRFAKHTTVQLPQISKDDLNILFVGRIVPNKRITDLIKVIKAYTQLFDNKINLLIVGNFDSALPSYKEEIFNLIKKYNLEDKIKFFLNASDELLASLYSTSDLFLCLSKHEGFCLPIIEAQAFNLPVVALSAAAVSETIGENQLLFNKIDYKLIASAINLIYKNKEIKNYLIKEGYTNYLNYINESIEEKTEFIINRFFPVYKSKRLEKKPSLKEPIKTVVVEGPFETSYSLAIVNRNLAFALKKLGFEVYLKPSEGPGDYIPKKEDLNKLDKKFLSLYKPFNQYPDILIRYMYPHRVYDVVGKINFFYFAWEESNIPKEIIDNFNTYLDGVICPSTWVYQVLRKNGLKIPAEVVGSGPSFSLSKSVKKIKQIQGIDKKFVFLHISSGFPRKGVDLLIKAFCSEFSEKDNVALIIKSFKNPHNQIKDFLKKQKKPIVKSIIYIEEDLSEEELNYLYKISSCVVYPTRGEGFGMPILDAMLKKIPVIVTGYGAHRDFCNEDNCYLIKYKFNYSKTHLKTPGSLWIEPDIDDLKKKMRFVYKNYKLNEVKIKIEKACLESKKYTWLNVAKKVKDFSEFVSYINKPLKLGMITTWNTKCGIASYSRFLINNLNNKRISLKIYANKEKLLDIDDEDNVIRCWNNALEKNLDSLFYQIIKDKREVVHFQFNYGFFNLDALANIIQKFKNKKIKIILTLHAVKDNIFLGRKASLKDISSSLRLADLILIHKKEDLYYLKNVLGLKNVKIFPHGIISLPKFSFFEYSRQINFDFKNNLVIGSFGYLLPHKGIFSLIKAIEILKNKYPNIVYLGLHSLFPNPVSNDYFELCRKYIKKHNLENNIIIDTKYYQEEEIIVKLHNCQLAVFPYEETKEAATGALRFALASQIPILTSRNHIFDDIKDAVYQVDNVTPKAIAVGIEKVLLDKFLSSNLVKKTKKIVGKYSWDKVAKQYLKFLYDLISN